jgi:C-terminal processing protease CtpA/Prc
MTAAQSRTSLTHWRTARRVVLGAIVLAASVATSAAVMYRMASHDCASYQQVERAYTYSGVGVVIERERGHVVVRKVLDGAPAEHKLFPGARLVSVDGHAPDTLEGWQGAIRGAPGTEVDLEIAYPCGGHKIVTLERDVIRVEY